MELINGDHDWYVADSYKGLETIGGIFEKDGKEYINVVLKSGKTRAARVYRIKNKTVSKTNHVIYCIRTELGFHPKGFVYAIRYNPEEKLQGICQWHPGLGPYLKCTDDIFDLPLGCDIRKVEWIDICADDLIHLKSNEEISQVVDSLFEKNKNL